MLHFNIVLHFKRNHNVELQIMSYEYEFSILYNPSVRCSNITFVF